MRKDICRFIRYLIGWYIVAIAIVLVFASTAPMKEAADVFVGLLLILIPIASTVGFVLAMFDNHANRKGK